LVFGALGAWCLVGANYFVSDVWGLMLVLDFWCLVFRVYRGTSLIINSHPPKGHHRALGIILL